MPSFGVAVAWMILAPIAVVLDILAILFIQHYRPLYHSTDVALTSLLFTVAMSAYFLLPIPAVLELVDLKWSHELCSFYTWLSTTLRFAHLLGLLILNVYWVTSLRTKPSNGHMFMSSMSMKISILISWFVSVVIGLAPITGGPELFDYYVDKRCNFLPSGIGIGFGVFIIVASLVSFTMGIISSSDTLLIFRSMKHIALTKYNAGRFHMPSVSGVARTGPSIHATYSELSVAHELCRLALCVTLVSSCINVLPFVVMQFMHLFNDDYRSTYEDVSLWLQLLEAILLPNLLWLLSSRYRHAVIYAWKVRVLRDSSAKEEDASACTLQSYKVRAMEQQSKATLNGIKKIQANGKTTSPMAQIAIPGNRRQSANKISPAGLRANGGEGNVSSHSESFLDDGMTVLSALPQQATEKSNGLKTSSDHQHLSNGEASKIESYQNDTYTLPLSKNKPPRKNMTPSNTLGPKVAFVDVAETAPEVGSPSNIASAVSSPTRSLASTPQRTLRDVKRTSSACSRREWKEKMRKKHLPAIFVNNSVDDDKEEKLHSSLTEEDKSDPVGGETYEMKAVKKNNSSEDKIESEIVNETKQQNYSEDNYYVSSEYHYNYLSDTFPRKLSIRAQSTIDSDGISNTYESDDIDNILDTSVVIDSAHHEVIVSPDKINHETGEETMKSAVPVKSKTELQSNGVEYVQVTYNHVTAPVIQTQSHSSANQSVVNQPGSAVKSSLEEFEENERNLLMSENMENETNVNTMTDEKEESMEPSREEVYSVMKVIDLEATGDTDKETSPIIAKSITIDDDNHGRNEGFIMNDDSFTVSQNYDQLETVSGHELLQLKQQNVKTVRTAEEFSFDSSSDDGGIDNAAFEGDSKEDIVHMGKEIIDESSFEYTNTLGSYYQNVKIDEQSKTDYSPQDITERFVTGKEDEMEQSELNNSDLEKANSINRKNPDIISDHEIHEESINDSDMGSLKRNNFATNPFLRESFEVIVQSPEYQQKLLAKDNPFFVSVKPLALPKQNTLESYKSIPENVKENEDDTNKNITSKPPIAVRPSSSSLADRIKPRPATASKSNAKPPVPIKKPSYLKKQTSFEIQNQQSNKEGENRFNRPRTSSEDELEKIFVKKASSVLHDDPSFPEEDPPSTTASNTDPDSPVFNSTSPKKDSLQTAHSLHSVVDDSVVIEPYGQRRPPWLDEHLHSTQNLSYQSSQNIPHVKSHSTNFNFSPQTFNTQKVEEYDFDSVRIKGVTETRQASLGVKSHSENSNFFNSSSDSSEITPVSEEERPTFQFYQFDDDIEKGFEDALSVDYLTHSNVYSGFGLCFESIKEEPEDSLSESASSFDGLGDSNSSAIFKTQAIVSRPSSRASVNSSNGDISSNNNLPNRLIVLPTTDQNVSKDEVSYENFASVGNEPFVTSERTSADGREEIEHHFNGNSLQTAIEAKDIKVNSSPWLEVKSADLDMSFESDFSQQGENYVMDSSVLLNDHIKETINDVTNNKSIYNNVDMNEKMSLNGSKENEIDSHSKTQISYSPVYF